ncbi:hypothetical protein AGOR_G00167340 [Albula goreensis]|uniref:Uncharacterized protein n=1 Tax=Albula goreensis TaxID=1534307 RepID=A0A8T3D2J3_9TELE|nr:hypothetical protein AGOR_G00167340 [Albula goreensis]
MGRWCSGTLSDPMERSASATVSAPQVRRRPLPATLCDVNINDAVQPTAVIPAAFSGWKGLVLFCSENTTCSAGQHTTHVWPCHVIRHPALLAVPSFWKV